MRYPAQSYLWGKKVHPGKILLRMLLDVNKVIYGGRMLNTGEGVHIVEWNLDWGLGKGNKS